ncbi:MAG: hypothetical protein ACXAEU_20780, partial [Candidatus Hodarchaeales archaeon]
MIMIDGKNFSEVFDGKFLDELMKKTGNLIEQAKVPSTGQFQYKHLLYRQLAEIMIILGTRLANQDFLDRGESLLESLNDLVRAEGYRKIGAKCFALEGDYDQIGEEYLAKSIQSWHLAISSPEKLNERFQLVDSYEFIKLLKTLKKNNLLALLDSVQSFIPDYINSIHEKFQPTRILDIAEIMVGIAGNSEIKAYLTRAERIRGGKDSKLQKIISSGNTVVFDGYFELQAALAVATKDENRLRTLIQQVKSSSAIIDSGAKLKIVQAFIELGNNQEAENLLKDLITETVNEWGDEDKSFDFTRFLPLSKAIDIAETCISLQKSTLAEPLVSL